MQFCYYFIDAAANSGLRLAFLRLPCASPRLSPDPSLLFCANVLPLLMKFHSVGGCGDWVGVIGLVSGRGLVVWNRQRKTKTVVVILVAAVVVGGRAGREDGGGWLGALGGAGWVGWVVG